MSRSVIAFAALVALTLGATGASAVQEKGRYKIEGDNCVWNADDAGPNQCTPMTPGRFKKEGDKCVWNAEDSGPNQCNPRQPR